MKFSFPLIAPLLGAVLPTAECLVANPRDSSIFKTRSVDAPNATAQLESILQQYNLPALGAAISPSFRSELVGLRRIDRNVSATKNDPFHIGSNGKSMVCTVLAILIEEGKLSWTTTLEEALPNFDMLPAYRNVTVELLTTMRSGITDDAASAADYFADFTLELYALTAVEGRRAAAKKTFSSPPVLSQGDWNYANINYAIVGLVIDAVTNSTTEEVVKNKLWKPLGMKSAGWGGPPEHSITSSNSPWPHNDTVEGIMPYGIDKPALYRDLPSAYNTAGICHMTIEDWNKFLSVHLNASEGKTSDALNLTISTFKKLHTSYPADVPEYPGYGYTYGGFLRQDYPDTSENYTLNYCGSNNRNYACVLLDTGLQKVFTTMTNVGPPVANDVLPALLLAMRNGTLTL